MWNRRPTRDRPRADAPTSGRITAIRQQERDPNRVSVFIDGEFAFGLGASLTLAEGLAVGDDLSSERVAALRARDEVGRATEAALRLVAQRPRSVHELRDRLRRREFAPESIEAAVERLTEWRYVDDTDFARLWVEHRERHRPRGRRLLEAELRQKGVDREIVREALDAAEIDEFAAALELGRAKLRGYAGLEAVVVRRRLGGYLARRGYQAETVRRVLASLLDDEPDQSESGSGSEE
jgi:regulatory protein